MRIPFKAEFNIPVPCLDMLYAEHDAMLEVLMI